MVPDRDMEGFAAAVMADIEGAEKDGMRRLLWRARLEGVFVGAMLGLFVAITAWALFSASIVRSLV